MKPTVARVMEAITLICPAKLNAVLSVGAAMDDGYHPVESVMLPLVSCEGPEEALLLQEDSSKSSEIELSILGNEVLSQSDMDANLVVKADQAFYRQFYLEPL